MDGTSPTYEELVEFTRRQAGMIEELRAEVEHLKRELEESRRAGKRQAAPCSKGAPEADPKRPGRKPGHAPSHRPTPPSEQVDRTIEVPLPSNCPECHAPLGTARVAVHDQYQIDLPTPKPVVTHFRLPVARCPTCRGRVQGRHPEETSEALGAAAVQYGPQLLGFAADLKHRLGVSYRMCSSVLLSLTGLVVASAALVRGGHRLRRLGEDYQGVLVSDCFLAHDPLPSRKGKCLAHLLKRCSEVEQSKSRTRDPAGSCCSHDPDGSRRLHNACGSLRNRGVATSTPAAGHRPGRVIPEPGSEPRLLLPDETQVQRAPWL